MDDTEVNGRNVLCNFLDFFFLFFFKKGQYLLDLTKRRFYFAEDNLSCTMHISKYVYEFVLFRHHFLVVQQSAFFFLM